jgi:hypothetical protein
MFLTHLRQKWNKALFKMSDSTSRNNTSSTTGTANLRTNVFGDLPLCSADFTASPFSYPLKQRSRTKEKQVLVSVLKQTGRDPT